MVSLLVLVLASAGQAAPSERPAPPDCPRLLSATPAAGVVPLCEAEDALALAARLASDAPDRLARLREAAERYGRAAELLQDLELKIYAYDALARLFDDAYLADASAAEQALRQLALIVAGTPAPLLRLAAFQETHEATDRAEHTLLGARQQYPDGEPVLRELSMFFARRVLAIGSARQTGDAPRAAAPATAPAYKPDCSQFSSGNPTSGLAQLCAAEAAMRQAGVRVKLPADAVERARVVEERNEQLRTAAGHLRTAADTLRETDARAYALDALVRVNGPANLNDPRGAEDAVRQLIALAPASSKPIVRLAALQEEQKLIDAAEGTLLGARPQFPDDLDLLKALSTFYARLATAAFSAELRRGRENEPPAVAGQPDANGFYGVGGSVPAPKKVQDVRPAFPKEAEAVDLSGVVIVELFLDETGTVVDARPLRAIPMLHEAAMAAVKRWQFEPTMVDGKAVPARLTVTVNFTLQKQ